jgi:hypothetical protein
MEPQLQGPVWITGLETGIRSVTSTVPGACAIGNSLLLNYLGQLLGITAMAGREV